MEPKRSIRQDKEIKFDVAGVDIVRSSHGPLVLEVNSSPGLEGIEKVTGKDIATAIIEHIEKFAVNRLKKRSNQKVKNFELWVQKKILLLMVYE